MNGAARARAKHRSIAVPVEKDESASGQLSTPALTLKRQGVVFGQQLLRVEPIATWEELSEKGCENRQTSGGLENVVERGEPDGEKVLG